jgi:hypothetical protein
MKEFRLVMCSCVLLLGVLAISSSFAGDQSQRPSLLFSTDANRLGDSTLAPIETMSNQPSYRNAWGLDILISNDGFGLGTFYRREFTEDMFGFATFSISESKDEREFEQYSYYNPYQSVTPGKLQRFMVMPLMFGIQHRLFREDITDNFRPFVNAGAGPALILSAPFVEFTTSATGTIQSNQIEFFKSFGKAQAHYTAGAFIGFGANFGNEKSSVFGVNFRYYFTYLFGDGLPSLFRERTAGEILARKKDFGGFFITLNVGMAY